MITDYDQFCRPIITTIHIGPIISQDTYLPNILTPKWHFLRHTNQEKINFVQDLSVSQQHTLSRSGASRLEAPDQGETTIQKLKLTSHKYHAMQKPSAFIHSHNLNDTSRRGTRMVVP